MIDHVRVVLDFVGLEEIAAIFQVPLIRSMRVRWIMVMVHHAIVLCLWGYGAVVIIKHRIVWSIEILIITVGAKWIGVGIVIDWLVFVVGFQLFSMIR